MAEETQTAYAKSAFSDPTNIVNFIALALTLPAINTIIPVKYAPLVAAIVALANLALRTIFVTHPVAIVAPGQTVPVEVKKLTATKQGTEDPTKVPPSVMDGSGKP